MRLWLHPSHQNPHPHTVYMSAGFREAEAVAKAELTAAAFSNAQNPDVFRKDLLNIAKTTLSSKILTADKEHFAELAVEAVTRLKGSGNLEAINIIKKVGGALKVPLLACLSGCVAVVFVLQQGRYSW